MPLSNYLNGDGDKIYDKKDVQIEVATLPSESKEDTIVNVFEKGPSKITTCNDYNKDAIEKHLLSIILNKR